MDPRPPDADFLKAAAARMHLKAEAEKRRQEGVRNRFRWVIWAFAALLLIALMTDLRNISRRLEQRRHGQPVVPRRGDAADIAAGLDGPRYTDPQGRFSVVPPRHWVRVEKPANRFFNVVFQGPYEMDLSIQVVATNGLTFEKLVRNLQQIEQRLSADTHMDFAYVGPYRAVKRSVQLFRSRVLLLDFVTGDLAHHVQFSIPPELYDQYEPVFLRLMQTYEPGRLVPAADAPPPAP